MSDNKFLQSAYKVLSNRLFLGLNDNLNLKTKLNITSLLYLVAALVIKSFKIVSKEEYHNSVQPPVFPPSSVPLVLKTHNSSLTPPLPTT